MAWYYSAGGAPDGPHPADEIENLFVTGQLTAETLVWRKGFPEWTPLADTEEFAHLVDDALPPPLPAARQQATAADVDGEVLVSDRVGDYRLGTDRADDDDDDEPPFTLAPPSMAHRLAGPWERYFARSIDLTIILSILLTGLYLVLPSISPKLALDLYFVEPAAMGIILLPLALVINAAIITLCGNSLGKAIFAIKAEPIDGRPRFGFGGNLKREFTVWLQGLALGIPVINLFTLVPAYRAVSRSAPAPYDVGRAAVRSYSSSQLRSTLGILFGMLLYLGIFALNGVERANQDALEQPGSWTNPTTEASVAVPPGWAYEAIPTASGPVHGFTNVKTGVSAILSFDTLPAGMDMASYTAAVSQTLAPLTTLGAWTASGTPEVWMATGRLTQGGYPSTLYAARNGTQVWRILYFDQLSTTPRQIVEPHLNETLFASAGIYLGR